MIKAPLRRGQGSFLSVIGFRDSLWQGVGCSRGRTSDIFSRTSCAGVSVHVGRTAAMTVAGGRVAKKRMHARSAESSLKVRLQYRVRRPPLQARCGTPRCSMSMLRAEQSQQARASRSSLCRPLNDTDFRKRPNFCDEKGKVITSNGHRVACRSDFASYSRCPLHYRENSSHHLPARSHTRSL
jgi:hypothetical protein